MKLEEIMNEIDAQRGRYVEELTEYVRIPSVSTYSENAGEVRRAAEFVSGHLTRLGFQSRIYETAKHPVVYAHRCPHPDRPVLLLYGHYDVQPPEPLEEWVTPPFSPDIRDGFLYARGATDDKGQFFTHLKAMEAILSVAGELPVNMKVLVEGEEEIGSVNLEAFLREHAEELRADAVAVSDTSQVAQGVPAITYGLRGLCYYQIDVQGPRIDLHSGSFGGALTNPVQALAEMLAKLKTGDERVAIPGFYDDVADMEDWERKEMASLPMDETRMKDYLGISRFSGERGYTFTERRSARPTLDVNGIWGGFAGEGAKTIIPAKAGAKVSMRLVPHQKPEVINRLFEEYIRSIAPDDVTVSLKVLHGADPVLVPRDRPAVQAAARAIEAGFGRRPFFLREGGSIPVVNLFKNTLGIEDILLLGWGSPDDGAHSPNERFFLDDFHRAIRSAAALLYELAAR